MRFVVKGTVRGKQRPRVTMAGGHARAYTPAKTKAYEDAIRAAYIDAGGTKLEGPVSVHVDVFRALPKSKPKSLVSEPDMFKPDGDNVLKCVLDALSGTAFHDDSQVVILSVIKRPRTRCEERIEVSVRPVSQRTVRSR